MEKLIKHILKEEISDEQLKQDIQFIIDEDLVEMEIYPDLTYVVIRDLEGIFPDINLSPFIRSLGYGEIFIDSYDNKTYYNENGHLHNINGPAEISPNYNVFEWYVEDKIIAYTEGGNLNIYDQNTWDKYFKDKQTLNENVSDEQLKSDIQFIIDEDLVDIEVYPDITYINLDQLTDILPNYDYFDFVDYTKLLKYGEVYLSNTMGKTYINDNDVKHNINGPALIYPEGMKYWYVDGVFIAGYSNNGLRIVKQDIWNQYFAKSYNP